MADPSLLPGSITSRSTLSWSNSNSTSNDMQGPSQLPSKFCTHCQRMLDVWIQNNYSYIPYSSHHDTVDDLQRSADRGCPLCFQFISDHVTTDDNRSSTTGMVKSYKNDRPEYKYMELTLCFASHTYTTSIFPNSTSISQTQNSAVPNTMDSLPQAKIWLKTCRMEHEFCRHFATNKTSTFVPTRLLDLRGTQLKLVLGVDLDSSIKYATLSHCWGDVAFIMLKQDCVGHYLTNIPDEMVPQTFKDAIYIARYFELNYLWIDSLCIIQDDVNDWRRESALMASVYGNSALNIAATGASNPSGGCFFERSPLWRCRLEDRRNIPRHSFTGTSDGRTTRKRTRKGKGFSRPTEFFECVPFSYSKTFQNMPLLQRGWVFQERMLSPRTLHFTKTELFWECKEMRVSERFPVESKQPFWDKDSSSLLRPPLDLETWRLVVDAYSKCQLTYARDKLVALSGLAQASQIGSQYFAGLWEEDLERQLCWKIEKGLKTASYRAPSWSWASLDGKVSFYYGKDYSKMHAKFLSAHVRLVQPEEPYGEVKSATLHLFCNCLFHGSIADPLSFKKKYKLRSGNYSDIRGWSFVAHQSSDVFYEIRGWSFDDESEKNQIEGDTAFKDCFFLPIAQTELKDRYQSLRSYGQYQSKPELVGVESSTFFLLLRPTGVFCGQYSRVGWMEMYSSDPGSWFDIVSRIQSKTSKLYIEDFPGVIELI